MRRVGNCYVYVVFRPDGTPCYVGKGKSLRWMDHAYGRSHNKYLKRIIDKAKRQGKECPIVIVRRSMTDKDAFETEIAFIQAIGRINNGGSLVNMTDGGEGLTNCGEETREKLRQYRTGKKASPELCAKLSEMRLGKKRPGTGKKIGDALRGKPKSEEHCKAMSIAAKKRGDNGHRGKYSEAHAAAIAAGVAAYWEKRRQQGLPLTNRTEAGHKKHSMAMLARYANRTADGKERSLDLR